MKTNLFGAGMCVFFALVVSSAHAVSYRIIDLGTLGGSQSVAWAINAGGQASGDSFVSETARRHAFLYDGSTMHDLSTLGAASSWGHGINNSGQVV